jgi:hypothetical protein
MNEANEKVLERIRQLLRMAADTSSPNEAAIAAGRARKLMDQHQVTVEDLKESNGFTFAKVDKVYRFMPIWKDILAVAIAKFNDCKASRSHEWKVESKSYSYRIMFQGYESDVAVATAMYDYLTTTVDRLCQRYIEELGYTKYPAKLGDAYKKAAAQALCDRLRVSQVEREQLLLTKTGTSLVVYKMAQVEAEFGAATYKNKVLSSRKGSDVAAAKARGDRDGRSISLAAQVKGGAGSPQIR